MSPPGWVDATLLGPALGLICTATTSGVNAARGPGLGGSTAGSDDGAHS